MFYLSQSLCKVKTVIFDQSFAWMNQRNQMCSAWPMIQSGLGQINFLFKGNLVGIDWSPMIWVKRHNKIVSPSACLFLSHGCICDCTSSPQEHDRLLQASLSLLTLSSLPARYQHRRLKCNSLLTILISSVSDTSDSICFSQCSPFAFILNNDV